MLEFIDLTTISIALMIIGAIGVVLLKKPLDKVIMVSILEAGLFLAIVSFKYLDVAFLTAVLDPLSIIVFLLALIKINEVRKSKLKDYSTLPKMIQSNENETRNSEGGKSVWGPGVKDPIIRTINTEVASVGVSLILLTYNSTLALLTLIATTIIVTLILFRAISRLEEIGADV